MFSDLHAYCKYTLLVFGLLFGQPLINILAESTSSVTVQHDKSKQSDKPEPLDSGGAQYKKNSNTAYSSTNKPKENDTNSFKSLNDNQYFSQIKQKIEEIFKFIPWYYWLAITILLLVGLIIVFILRLSCKKPLNSKNNTISELEKENKSLTQTIDNLSQSLEQRKERVKELEDEIQKLTANSISASSFDISGKNPIPGVDENSNYTTYYASFHSENGFKPEIVATETSMFEIKVFEKEPKKGFIALKNDLSSIIIESIATIYYVYENAFTYKKGPTPEQKNLKTIKEGKVYFDDDTGYWKIEGNNKIEVEFY